MECHNLFSKIIIIKKNVVWLSSAGFAQRMVKVNSPFLVLFCTANIH